MKTYSRYLLLFFALMLPVLTSTVVAQSSPAYTIRGDVMDEYGKPAAGVRVCAFPDASQPGREIVCGSESTEEGKYILYLVKGGKYQLYCDRPDGHMWQNHPFYRQESDRIPTITVDAENPNVTTSLFLNPISGAVSGKVIDAKTKLPVDNIQITLCKLDHPEICYMTHSKTATGRFFVYGSVTSFTMKITAEGFEDWLGTAGGNQPGYLISGAILGVDVKLKRRKETARLAINDAEKKVGVYLPAPVQQFPGPNAMLSRSPRVTKLEWEAVKGAVSYTVEIDVCQAVEAGREDCVDPQPHNMVERNPTPKGLTGTSYEFDFVGANPGRWRVWAVDKEGRAGFKSPWRKFTHLR